VATSILFNGAGVVGIYGVGTIPQARHRGVGAAMTLESLLDAHQQGYHFAVLFSSRMGYSVYKRLGFREVACRIGVYVLERRANVG
jgi:predicted acetyltransferase